MAESMTYDSLLADVEVYAERSDTPFTDQIPRFVMMAENRLASEIRGLGYIRYVSGTLTQGNTTFVKPARWRETASFSITVSSNRTFLQQRSYQYCREFWPNSALEDQPRFYADYDYEHFFLAATPDAAYDFEIGYFERPEPLDSTNQTNWTTQYAPQLLLYATLLEAQPFLKLDQRMQVFQTMFDRAKSMVEQENARRLTGDQTLARSSA